VVVSLRDACKFKEVIDKYNSRQILLYGDPDVDGLMSLLLMCQFCDMLGLSYYCHVNDARQHGFALDPEEVRGMLVIAADFSIPRSMVSKLVCEYDVVLLSTDHHAIKGEFINIEDRGFVWNNQYYFEPDEDRYLSGAGVFYELVCSLYPDFVNRDREAIVGITLLSDVRSIENPKARRYLKRTYTMDTTQGYGKYLCEQILDADYGFGVPKVDRNFIDFSLSPTINAMLRANKTAEAVDFVLGNGLKVHIRDRQKSLLRMMEEKADEAFMENMAVIIVNQSDFDCDITSYIGLLCSSFKDKHKNISTLGMVVKNGVVQRASFRGRFDDSVPYLLMFQKLGISADGHPNAFGIKDFYPDADLWVALDSNIGKLEEGYQLSCKIIETANLSAVMRQKGNTLAKENCFVRDIYRTYLRYTGSNIQVIRKSYQMEEITREAFDSGVKADVVSNGVPYRYLRSKDGKPLHKYIEYMVDGYKVKSFGVCIEDGLILPILEKGYTCLYVRDMIC